jgi:hypothetical protein
LSEPSTNGKGLELEALGPGDKTPASTSPKMLVPLFLVPLLIVAVIVGIFWALGSMLGQEKTVTQWIDEVESGGVNGRWQAAAQLAAIARANPEKLEEPATRERLRHLFAAAGPTEPRIRQYLAAIWTETGDPEAAPLVIDGIERTQELLQHTDQARPEEVERARGELTYYLLALGSIGNGTAEAALLKLVKDPDPHTRQTVASALGSVGRKAIKNGVAPSPELIAALRQLHDDEDAWVRMNAALSLGKVGSAEGMPTLETMLDRDWLKRQNLQFPDDGKYPVTEHDPAAEKILSAMVTIESLLDRPESGGSALDRATVASAVEKAANDPNPEVQRRATALLAKLRS